MKPEQYRYLVARHLSRRRLLQGALGSVHWP